MGDIDPNLAKEASPQDTGVLGSSVSESGEQDTPPTKPDKPSEKSRILFFPYNFIKRVWSDPEDTHDGRFRHSEYERVSVYPHGYPRWAAYQNSDPMFGVYRRFGTKALQEMDEDDEKKNPHRIQSLEQGQEDHESKRTELMEQIDKELEQYDALVERERRSAQMQRPTKRNYRSLVNYLWNQKPIVWPEMAFLSKRDDFVLLMQETESPLEQFLDHIVCCIPVRCVRRLFTSEAQRTKFDKDKNQHTYLTSPTRIRILARLVASLLAILVIGIPLGILSFNGDSNRTKQIVLLVALAFFPIALSVSARPKNHDLFAATAAYCAVLSAFLATNSFNFTQGQLQSANNSPFASY